ncbi:MAG: ATP-binding protein [Spirochaetales bacterium]|nr:ATP-binding protein [Spirochaetales bacterium]
MQGYVERAATKLITRKLANNPAAAIIGPRQCGKSTLARHILKEYTDALYLDLEKPSDVNKLRDPEAFFSVNKDKLVCLDEIQRRPDLFPLLRSILDERNRNGQLLILGSASPELLKQSSESLAGRISFIELTPFYIEELAEPEKIDTIRGLWLKGGFPRSWLAQSSEESFEWRQDFIRTFLERDIPGLGFNITGRKMDRFLTMCAHVTGQLLNSSKLGASLGVSGHTVRSYIDLLEHAFMIRILLPYEINVKKRLVKSPKVYIRDTGILHALLSIASFNELLGNPVCGPSWEAFAIENILSGIRNRKPFFYRTAAGAEVDLVLAGANGIIAIECKLSTSPAPSKGFWNALDDLSPSWSWIIAPVKEMYTIERGVTVGSPFHFLESSGW